MECFDFNINHRDNYYQILGCDRHSNVSNLQKPDEQIIREYKIRALETHPDKNCGPDAEQKFKQLLTAKEVLLDAKRRKMYDKWIDCGILMSFEKWERLSQSVQTSMHWVNTKRTPPMIEPKTGTKQVWERDHSFTLDEFRNYRI
ncbi:hypothetical protein B4U80_04389 [Leptotrombidium deliense]|uniref:J domain-containing protein n=1 Tax=Leptotrombidium deliense TaxID=299467 RepID=A0A443SAF4_9ACAR|nr:hypothetical protein B4U80_04389 [Leptotrombidium deliense]